MLTFSLKYILKVLKYKLRYRWAHDPNAEVLTPDQVTPEMLDNVADYVSSKVYSHSGTTYHQCRQKTTDQKTVCRSGNCAGVRFLNLNYFL